MSAIPSHKDFLELEAAGQTGENALGKDQVWRSETTSTACSDCSQPQTLTPQLLTAVTLCYARYVLAGSRCSSSNPSSAEARPHCAPTKDFGPWPISRGSLCVGFSVKAHPELWKCLLNPFFLVLQVTVAVWRDTPRAQGLPGRCNDG